MPNRYNPNYKRNFLIISVLAEQYSFNEIQHLFDKDSIYGSLVIADKSEILNIDKSNLKLIADEPSIDQLRAECAAKERLFK